MCVPNKVASLLQRVFTSYEEGLLIEVKASLIDECFPFIKLELF